MKKYLRNVYFCKCFLLALSGYGPVGLPTKAPAQTLTLTSHPQGPAPCFGTKAVPQLTLLCPVWAMVESGEAKSTE